MKTFLLLSAILLHSIAYSQSQKGDFHLDKEYNLSKLGTIDLHSSDAKVFVTGSKRPKVHVKIDRVVTAKGWIKHEEHFEVLIEEENGDLEIREKQNSNYSGIMGYYKEDYTINIEAPEGASLVVRGDDGDYFIKNINGSISMSLDDADAELSDCLGSNFKFRLDDGDIRMNQGKGDLEIHADDADVFIYKGQFASIQADIDDGDLNIETSLNDSGKYNLSSEDGSIVMNITGGGGTFTIHHDDGNIRTNGNFNVKDENENVTIATLAAGSANVSLRAEDANVNLSSN